MNLLPLRRWIGATLGLLGLAGGDAASQSPCLPPVVQVLLDKQEVPSTGAAFAPKMTLLVRPAPGCATGDRYWFSEAEVTLLRGRRPVLMTTLVRTSDVDLTYLAPTARPGDRIYVFVLYQNLYLVGARGERRPYPRSAPGSPPPTGIRATLTTDEARGIGFTWVLTK